MSSPIETHVAQLEVGELFEMPTKTLKPAFDWLLYLG